MKIYLKITNGIKLPYVDDLIKQVYSPNVTEWSKTQLDRNIGKKNGQVNYSFSWDKFLEPKIWDENLSEFSSETIQIEEINKKEYVVQSLHVNLLEVDRVALIKFAIIVAKKSKALLSVDEKYWVTWPRFLKHNSDILNLSFNQLVINSKKQIDDLAEHDLTAQ